MKEEQREHLTAYITKYALTEGILVVRGEICHDISSGMFCPDRRSGGHAFHGKDWHRTPEAALARAEEMRKKKIASIQKQIKKIEAMEFKIPCE